MIVPGGMIELSGIVVSFAIIVPVPILTLLPIVAPLLIRTPGMRVQKSPMVVSRLMLTPGNKNVWEPSEIFVVIPIIIRNAPLDRFSLKATTNIYRHLPL